MDRGERRRRAEVKLAKRLRYNNNPESHADGKMRKTPTPCSCFLCKPHKHGLETKYKPSERRKLQDGESDL
jgi:hypothetical protein